MTDEQNERFKLSTEVALSFSPSAPVDETRLFAGRTDQVIQAINTVAQKGQHAILYGERGVGKTSLANVLSALLSDVGLKGWTVIANCDSTSSFASIWQQVARELNFSGLKNRAGFGGETEELQISGTAMLPEEISPDSIRHWFQQLPKSAIVIIDEMDRINDPTVATLFADTVKSLSDHAVDATLILVGVADSVDELINEHRSIERALTQIRMPRMSVRELEEIVDKGFSQVNMAVDQKAKHEITKLSQGLPHFTHLLSLYAGQSAAMAGRKAVSLEDVDQAIEESVDKAQQSIVSSYYEATSSSRETLYPKVLLACALTPKDGLGFFSAADVRAPLTFIMHKQVDIPTFSRHLHEFCETKRGCMLQKTGEKKRFRYRFSNPMMEPFVTMAGLADGSIDKDALRAE